MSDSLAQALSASKNAVFFGGAGVSTESGIPDFRSEAGLYSARERYGHSPEEILSHSFFACNPAIFFDYYRRNLIYPDAKPNAAHTALSRLEQMGLLSAIITQNIDGLHQKAGSSAVFELHGSVYRNYCVGCGEKYPVEHVLACGDGIPVCHKCGGIVRPEVVLYEEPLGESVWAGAIHAVKSADTLIVGGTSLSVYPAAGLLHYFNGDVICLINKTQTPFDSRADILIRDSIGKALSEAVMEISG